MSSFRFLIVPYILFTGLMCSSQKLQDLHKDLSAVKTETAKIKAMIAIGKWHLDRSGNIKYPASADSTFFYANKSETHAKRTNNTIGLGLTYLFYSEISGYDMKFTEASKYAQQSVKLFENETNKKYLCEAYNFWLTAELESTPLFENFMTIAEKALKLSRQNNDKFSEAWVLDNIGLYHSRLGDYNTALNFLEQSVAIYKIVDAKKHLKSVYPHMAAFYAQLGNIDKATKCIHEALTILKKSQEYTVMDSFNYGSIGDTYSAIGNTEAAITNCEISVEIASHFSNKNYQAINENSLMDMLYEVKKYEKAKKHFSNLESYIHNLEPNVKADVICMLLFHSVYYNYKEKADKYALLSIKQVNSPKSFIEINRRMYSALMRYYFYIKDYRQSKEYASKYKKIALESKSLYRLELVYRHLFQVDSAQGNFAAAIENYKKADLYKDSIQTEDRLQEVARLEMNFNSREKEKDNQLLKRNNELQEVIISKAVLEKRLILITIIILLIAIVLKYRRYQINAKIKKQINQRNDILQGLLHEKEFLIKEVDFRVSNNLNIIMDLLQSQSQTLTNKASIKAIKNSQDRIQSMNLIHRQLYPSVNLGIVNVKVYVEELLNYFKLSFNMNDRITFITDIDQIQMVSSQAVPLGLIITETVTNSLKHAFPNNENGQITINLKQTPDGKIILKIQDNGQGITNHTELKTSTTLGIKLITGFSTELKGTIEFNSTSGFSTTLTFSPEVKSLTIKQ